MRETLLPLLRDNYPKVAKDLLGALLEVMSAARSVTGGDLDKFLVFLVITMRTVEDRRFADVNFEDVLAGDVESYPSLRTNIRSVAESTGIPKETVRRKVAALVEAGWVDRDGNDLSITTLASQRFTTAREPLLQMAARCYLTVESLKAQRDPAPGA